MNAETLLKDRSQDALLQREFQSIQAVHNVKLGNRLSMRSGITGKRLAYKFISNDYSMTTYPKDVNEVGYTFLLERVFGSFLPGRGQTHPGCRRQCAVPFPESDMEY